MDKIRNRTGQSVMINALFVFVGKTLFVFRGILCSGGGADSALLTAHDLLTTVHLAFLLFFKYPLYSTSGSLSSCLHNLLLHSSELCLA